MFNYLFFSFGLILSNFVEAQNVAMTSTGIAVAAMGPDGLVFQQSASTGQPETQSLPMGIESFDDVSVDVENEALVFALSTVSQRVCSFTIMSDGLNLVNCVGDGFEVDPFCGISALGGTLIISGGTGGLTVYQYNTDSGVISESPNVLNLELGVIGHPDVVLVDANLAALSTDFSGSPRFGTQMASIEDNSVIFVRDFRVQDSLGFQSSLRPANFPLVNAIYNTEGNTYMYTANGAIQVQNPRLADTVTILSTSGAPNGFSAVTVAVNAAREFLLFGGLIDSGGSAILIYDLSGNPLNPTLVESILLSDQRITSIASGDDVAAYTTQGGDTIIRYQQLPTQIDDDFVTIFEEEFEGESGSFPRNVFRNRVFADPNCNENRCLRIRRRQTSATKFLEVIEFSSVEISFIYNNNSRVNEKENLILEFQYRRGEWVVVSTYLRVDELTQVTALVSVTPGETRLRFRFRGTAGRNNRQFFVDNVVTRGFI